MHRTPEQPFSEELLELLEQRRTTEVKQEEVTNTVTQEKVSQTELNTIRQQVVERTAEDIGEIVNRSSRGRLAQFQKRCMVKWNAACSRNARAAVGSNTGRNDAQKNKGEKGGDAACRQPPRLQVN